MTSLNNEKQISKELEDEIYEKKLLEKLDCIEKLTGGRQDRNIFIIHPNHGMLYQYKELAQLLEKKFNVYGVKAMGLAPGKLMPETPRQLLDEYLAQILKVQEKGPFILSGFCIGNAFAFALAHNLERRGHKVEKLVLLDSIAFVRDHTYKLIRWLRFFPGFVKKKLFAEAEKRFKREMRLKKYILKESDEGGFRKTKVEKYMDVAGRYIFILGIVDAPLLVPHGLDSSRPGATQARFDRLTRSTAALFKVPGTHEGMLKQPDVERLAQLILDQV